jgi:hypothetical protein
MLPSSQAPTRRTWTKPAFHVGPIAQSWCNPRVGINYPHFCAMSLNRRWLCFTSHIHLHRCRETPCGIKDGRPALPSAALETLGALPPRPPDRLCSSLPARSTADWCGATLLYKSRVEWFVSPSLPALVFRGPAQSTNPNPCIHTSFFDLAHKSRLSPRSEICQR